MAKDAIQNKSKVFVWPSLFKNITQCGLMVSELI
uniref:Uncharacterized protein n=1 Tax=Anguilla anguilla TaxID=7936 RepID=A0A0E9QL88_ANGAN